MAKINVLMAGSLLGISLAASTHAATFVAVTVGLVAGPPVTADVNGREAYLQPQVLTNAAGEAIDFYCIDPDATDVLGAQSPPVQYDGVNSLSQLGLTSSQAGELQWLANYAIGKSPDVEDAVQGAMFEVVGGSVSDISNATVATDLNYLMAHPGDAAFTGALVPQVATDQTGLSSGAPEPASWALMLSGVGAVGGAVRRRRSLVLAT